MCMGWNTSHLLIHGWQLYFWTTIQHSFIILRAFSLTLGKILNFVEPYLSNNEFINETKINEVHEKYNEAFSLTLGKTLDFVELNKAMNEMKINEVCEKDNENIIMCSWCLECNYSYCKCRPEKRSNDGYCLKCGRFRCKKTNYGNYKLGPHKFNYKGKLIK
ncbi:hypothetical protein RhiirC2_784234 [Rhizophagus irregularis]|uniref:Uncharacterized protein n=1 Tax=Rhizophagus irregularis TaxID=588596 RepID=A0A2N1MZ85_9GLOM|nr:hypothetical protein RhiirC2_784234 [Rhizophagus irregularis]